MSQNHFDPLPQAPPGWYVRLRDDIVAARTSLIAVAVYAVVLWIPDQSAEAIRTTFGSTSGWQFLVFFGWFAFLAYASMALVGSAFLGFVAVDQRNTALQPASEGKTSTAYRHTRRRKIALLVLSAAPAFVTIVAVVITMAPTVWVVLRIPFSAWVFITSCIVSALVGYRVLLHDEKRIEEATVNRTRREEEATAEQTQREEEATVDRTRREEEATAEQTQREEEATVNRTRREEEATAEQTQREEEATVDRTRRAIEAAADRTRGMAEAAAKETRRVIETPVEHAWGLVMGAALGGLFVLLCLRVSSYAFGVVLDPPSILILTVWITIVLAFLTWLDSKAVQRGLPLLTFLLIWLFGVAVLDLNDNHLVRSMPQSPEAPPQQPITDAFDEWLKARDPDIKKFTAAKKPYPVFLIAAEGGGARAALMTALVLEQFRVGCPDLLRHTFVVIGVSGGSLGAMLGSAAMRDAGISDGCSDTLPKDGPKTQATEAAAADMLRPLLRGLLFADLPMHFFPSGAFSWLGDWPGAGLAWLSDRTQYLEHGIDLAWRENTPSPVPQESTSVPARRPSLEERGFSDLWQGPSGSVPALMLLTTDVDSGRRIAVSHLRLPGGPSRPASRSCALLDDPNEAPADRARLMTLSELMPGLELPAISAAILSARFPGVTSAGRLPCADRVVRLVDGGFFENSGLTTAIELIRLIRKKAAESQVVLTVVQIENSRATTDWSFEKGALPTAPDHYLPELMSPLRAIAGTRQARADLARVAMEQSVASADGSCLGHKCLTNVRFELRPCRTPIPLGWSLSDEAREDIRRQLFSPDATGDDKRCMGLRPSTAPTSLPGPLNVETFRSLVASVRIPVTTASPTRPADYRPAPPVSPQ